MLSAAFSMNRSDSGTWRVSIFELVVVFADYYSKDFGTQG